jgi:hypothetical protein
MRVLKLCVCVCLVAGGLAVAAGDALALQSPSLNCNAHNKLTHHYSVKQLEHALATMPAQIKEYTPCFQVIQAQLSKQLGSTVTTGTTGTTVTTKSGGSSLSGVLIVVIVVIVLAGGGLAFLASRRNSRTEDGSGDGDESDGDGDGNRGGNQLPPAAGD